MPLLSRKVSCAPNSCEVRSQVLLFRIYQKYLLWWVVNKQTSRLFWLQISAEKFIIKTNICSIIICEVRIWQRALSSMTRSSLAMTHPRVKKDAFFLYDYRWIFIWCSSTNFGKFLNFKLQNFCSSSLAGEHMFQLIRAPHRSSLFVK